MDVLRQAYKTRCKFFRDSPLEDEVTWYPALPGAPLLDFPSVVCTSYLDPTGVFFPPGGEVYGAPKPIIRDATKPGALGGHVCGTAEDFGEGCLFDASPPTVQYQTNGLPSCCGAIPRVAGGGAGGGRVVVAVSVEGGPDCSGAADLPENQTGTGTLHLLGVTDAWWRFPATNGTTYFFNATSDQDCGWQIQHGVACPPSGGYFSGGVSGGSTSTSVTALATDFIFIRLYYDGLPSGPDKHVTIAWHT